MSVEFPAQEILNFQRAAEVGGKAENILASPEWQWIEEKIFGALQDQAINILKNAKTEEDRVKAQQQFIAAHKPKDILEGLIRDGKAAIEMLKRISNQEGEING